MNPSKATEVEVLKVTVEQLKTAFAQINNNATDGGTAKIKKERKTDSDDDAADGNGWDDFDVDEDDDDATSSPSAAAEMPGTRAPHTIKDCTGWPMDAWELPLSMH